MFMLLFGSIDVKQAALICIANRQHSTMQTTQKSGSAIPAQCTCQGATRLPRQHCSLCKSSARAHGACLCRPPDPPALLCSRRHIKLLLFSKGKPSLCCRLKEPQP